LCNPTGKVINKMITQVLFLVYQFGVSTDEMTKNIH
jgi:hypothetical protein